MVPVHPLPTLEVRRAADRTTTTAPGVVTRHSFSFGRHYDPANTGHGLLVAHNDERVLPGHGFAAHPHRDVEIVTWVVSGTLRHEDEHGGRQTVGAGSVQVLSAGSGVRHAEGNHAEAGPDLRFVQMWLRPSRPGTVPAYSVAAAPPGRWVPLASGLPDHPATAHPLPLGCPATLHLARLTAGETATLPRAAFVHVFVVSGEIDLSGEHLAAADAARLTGVAGHRLELCARTDAHLLVWEMLEGPSGRMG